VGNDVPVAVDYVSSGREIETLRRRRLERRGGVKVRRLERQRLRGKAHYACPVEALHFSR